MEEEKVVMEVTKGEALFVLGERIDNTWQHELMPVIILAPAIIIAFLFYELLPDTWSPWACLTATMPIIVVAVYLIFKWYKSGEKKAMKQYELMKSDGQITIKGG